MDVHGDAAEAPEVDEELLEDVEAPEADAAEQHRALRQDSPAEQYESRPMDVDEYDAAEQQRVVEFDEDDYR